MESLGLISIFVLAWSLQVFLAYQQNKTIIKEIQEIQRTHHSGHLGVGQSRWKLNFGSGVILILVTNNQGQIEVARLMQGVTVFQRFKTLESLLQLSVNEAYSSLTQKNLKGAFFDAITNINQQRKKDNLSELTLV